MQKKLAQLREEFQTEVAKLTASLRHCPVSKALHEIQLRERMARKFRTLHKIFKPGKSSGLDRIDVPNEFAVRREGVGLQNLIQVTGWLRTSGLRSACQIDLKQTLLATCERWPASGVCGSDPVDLCKVLARHRIPGAF